MEAGDQVADSYRDHLVEAGHTASRDYDRALMTLSGGALGVSIAFVRDLVPHPEQVLWLGVSWMLFATSLLFILASILISQFAIRIAIGQHDKRQSGQAEEKVPGGMFSYFTIGLNVAAGAAFVTGVVCLALFAVFNLKGA